MKKATLYLMILLLSVSFIPTSVYATDKKMETTTSIPPKEVPIEIKVMLDRLKEIKAMDKSNMNRAEKKELRKEVRTINKSLRATGNGVYISVGALLIIILLIILL